jgi:DNA primase
VVALAQLGLGNAVATLGTACTAEHVHKLFRFTESVVFSFDGDGAGRRAARKALDAALPLATDTRSVKFLFLPTEHDPDSFIRERGADAFAAAVKGALPLSRFLLDAAAADCDLDSAEGRARMASQARPLWSAMPDGALKRQLLGEIADMVQLGTHELNELWGLASPPRRAQPRAAQHGEPPGGDGPRNGGWKKWDSQREGGWKQKDGNREGGWRRKGESAAAPRRPGGRMRPASRSDRAVGLLLANAGAWDHLSAEDQALLAHLPEPHGPLLAWLESQLHEHGPLPWAALREALQGHPNEGFALQQVEQVTAGNDTEAELLELQDVMARVRLDAWEQEAAELALLAEHDGDALRRLRELTGRIRAQKAAAASTKTDGPV